MEKKSQWPIRILWSKKEGTEFFKSEMHFMFLDFYIHCSNGMSNFNFLCMKI